MIGQNNDLRIVEIDSVKVYEPYVRLYVTRKLIEIGFDISNSGFNYFREIILKMLCENGKKKTLRDYFNEFSNGSMSYNQIDKAINFTLSTSYIRSNGFSRLNDCMGWNAVGCQSNSRIFYIIKEYLSFCLYDDYITFLKKNK